MRQSLILWFQRLSDLISGPVLSLIDRIGGCLGSDPSGCSNRLAENYAKQLENFFGKEKDNEADESKSRDTYDVQEG